MICGLGRECDLLEHFGGLDFTRAGQAHFGIEHVLVTGQQTLLNHVVDNSTNLIRFDTTGSGDDALWDFLANAEGFDVAHNSLFKNSDVELFHVEILVVSRFDGISITKTSFSVNTFLKDTKKASIKRLF